MATRDTVRLTRRWFDEVWNARREAVALELMAPDARGHMESGDIVGPAAFLDQFYRPFTAAFPDLQVVVEDVLADGDDACVRWPLEAPHRGEAFGLRPTGRHVSRRGITWLRFRNGRIIEGWDAWNQAAVMQTLAEAPAATA